MPLYFGILPTEEKAEEPPEIRAEELKEIQENAEQLAEVVKSELIKLKQNKQKQTTGGAKVYHELVALYRTLIHTVEYIETIPAEE